MLHWKSSGGTRSGRSPAYRTAHIGNPWTETTTNRSKYPYQSRHHDGTGSSLVVRAIVEVSATSHARLPLSVSMVGMYFPDALRQAGLSMKNIEARPDDQSGPAEQPDIRHIAPDDKSEYTRSNKHCVKEGGNHRRLRPTVGFDYHIMSGTIENAEQGEQRPICNIRIRYGKKKARAPTVITANVEYNRIRSEDSSALIRRVTMSLMAPKNAAPRATNAAHWSVSGVGRADDDPGKTNKDRTPSPPADLSPRTKGARAATINGPVNVKAMASARGIRLRAVMMKNVDPMKHSARIA